MINLHLFKQWLSVVVMISIVLPISSPPSDGATSIASENISSLAQIAQGNHQIRSKPFFWQRQPKRPLTIRGDMICPISPGLIGKLTVWHDRPLFIWQGEGKQIRVRKYNQRDKILWEPTISKQEPLRYEGQEALLPDQLYQWQVIPVDPKASNDPIASNRPKTWETFKILPADQRQEIAAALRMLEQRLKQQRASAEDIALSKAEFFADRGLWSDALQVIYQVENPSAEFVKQRSSYVASLCRSPNP